jgi:hypothetical protein
MIRIGQRVTIHRLNDDDPHSRRHPDAAARRFWRFKGKTGIVRAIVTEGNTGETPDDPLYSVTVPHVGTDGFWSEEITGCSA